MLNEGRDFLNVLDALLGGRGKDTLYLCIRDLVEHGLDLARFAGGETTPQRQDITQYLAAWSRHAGLSEDQTKNRLIDYCMALLASISRRTPAAIRHSTKSNIRYIYQSAIPLLCQCADNPFRAHCSPDCPVHADMQAKLRAKAIEELNPKPMIRPPAPIIEVVVPVKKANQEQFQAGLRLALEEVQKGKKLPRIVAILNERGLKTRTGRKWQYNILRNELGKLKNASVPPPEDGKAAEPKEDSKENPGRQGPGG